MHRSRCVCSAHWRLTPRACRCGSVGRPSGRCWPAYSSRARCPSRRNGSSRTCGAGGRAPTPCTRSCRGCAGCSAATPSRSAAAATSSTGIWSHVDADAFVAEVDDGRRALARGADAEAAALLEAALARWRGERGYYGSSRRRRHPGRRRRGRPARRAAGGGGRGARRRARPARPRRRGRRPARRAGGALPAAGVVGRPAGDGALRGRPPGRRAHRLRALPSGAWPSSSAWTRPRRCAASTRRCWPSRRWAR